MNSFETVTDNSIKHDIHNLLILLEAWSLIARMTGSDRLVIPRILEACDVFRVPYEQLADTYARYAQDGYTEALERDLGRILKVPYNKILYDPTVLN
jgi:hypothetical protein